MCGGQIGRFAIWLRRYRPTNIDINGQRDIFEWLLTRIVSDVYFSNKLQVVGYGIGFVMKFHGVVIVDA